MLRKTGLRAASSKRSQSKQAHCHVTELVRQRDELREEVRQLRAAMVLWAKVAESTCTKCVQRRVAPIGLLATKSDLIQLGQSLRNLEAATSITVSTDPTTLN
jgi:uncharacterized coiled-coil DUF342 family protein